MKKISLLLSLFIIFSCAKDSSELTVYTSRQPQLIEPIVEQFTNETGIKVNLLSGNAQELMERIDIEGEDSPADIFMTVDAGVLWQAAERDILAKIDSEILNENIPAHLRDSKNEWFVYNRSLIASMIDAYGFDKSKEVVSGWVSNLATEVFSNDTNALKAVSSGQCGVTIVNTYYLARLLDDPEYNNLSLFWANQSDRGVHVNISGAGVVNTSKNKKNAVLLLEYLSSNKAQDFYASANKEYPVLIGAKIDESIENWGSFSEHTINVSKLGSLQKEAVFLAQEVGYK